MANNVAAADVGSNAIVPAAVKLPSLQEAEEAGRVHPYLDSLVESIRSTPYSELHTLADLHDNAILGFSFFFFLL